MSNAINWFEIPCTDLSRAITFYEKILEVKLERTDFNGVPHAIFSGERTSVRGALVCDRNNAPSERGSLLYLNVTGKLDACLKRAAEIGAKVLVPRTSIGDPGFIALLQDSEGNRVGLHSPT
ncbi:MAG TPA: VOC family protein [Polyangiales bacterium]|nr:VOC family protein [Polyangiales bacterium]